MAVVVSAQSSTGNTIKGKVRTQSGRPLANVLVELQTGTGGTIAQTVTSNEGDYLFGSLAGASFLLVVRDSYHQPYSERVELTRTATTRPGETRYVDVTLTPLPSPSTHPPGEIFQQDVPGIAVDLYKKGTKLVAERKSTEGMTAFRKAIAAFADYFDAHFAIAVELLRLGRYDESITELETARRINSRDSRLYHTFGLVLFQQKKYALAAAAFRTVAQMDSTNAEARLMRGAALIEIGSLEAAEYELNRADLISRQGLAMVHIHLARIYEKRGQNARAAKELEAYLRMNPRAENAEAIREATKRLRAK
jgi:tetratricopeptide (TPR) repeat protein